MMTNTQDKRNLRLVHGTSPVAVTRAYAKARFGDLDARRWLIEEAIHGNAAASKALSDLDRATPAPSRAA